MALYKIIKGNDILGPFDVDDIVEFVRSGLVLRRDYTYGINSPDVFITVDDILKLYGKTVTVEHKGSILTQIKDIGKELILPHAIFTKEPWKKDKSLFILALVGLSLSVIISFSPFLTVQAIFYFIALYFSAIWGLFFYYLFKTDQVRLSTTIYLFIGTQVLVSVVFTILGAINPFQAFYQSSVSLLSLVSCIVGIGVPEECVKFIPVLLIIRHSKSVTKPQTAVFYGLMSGIAFGVYEGVMYQMGPNFRMLAEGSLESGYVNAHLSNIARLTSLPFLHAVWCGIASYFVSFAFLYPRYRKSLFVLAVLIPATIHGVYDWICFNVNFPFLELPVVFIGVILLMVYLRTGYSFHSKLSD